MLLVDVEKDHLDILKSNHIFIKHSGSVSAGAMKVNGINLPEHNEIAIGEDEACEEINKFVDKNKLHETKLLGHNFHFDRGFLNALFGRVGFDSKLHDFHEDTMYLWRALKKGGLIPFDLRSNLGTIAEYFDVDYRKAHDALADCNITAKVYHKMLGL